MSWDSSSSYISISMDGSTPISCWEYISNKPSTIMNDVYKCTLVPSGNSSLPTICRTDTVTMSSGPVPENSLIVTHDAPLTKATSNATMFGKYALHFTHSTVSTFPPWISASIPGVMATPLLIKSYFSSGVVMLYVKS